jgi:hypothetical protein
MSEDVSAQQWKWHCFSGPRRDVAKSLFSLPQEILSSPLYTLLLAGENCGAVHIYECVDQDQRKVTRSFWKAPALGDLPSRVLSVLAALPRTDDASGSPRDAVRSLLAAERSFSTSAPALAPATARAAFGLPLDSTAGAQVCACVIAF